MRELNWRLVLLGILLSAMAAAAIPYVTLKLGQSVDLTMAGMFLAAVVLGRTKQGQALAIELNIVQTMIGVVSGIAFMVVIQAGFFYIQTVFNRDIGYNPTPLQMFVWLFVSANLGVFMGIVPRRSILKDRSLPWPLSRANLAVAKTLTDPVSAGTTKVGRDVLMVSTGAAGFLTFLRDGFGVLKPIVGNAALNIALAPEFAAIGIGMLVPLSVGMSSLIGTWIIYSFGDTMARFAALSGVSGAAFDTCLASLDKTVALDGSAKVAALDFLNANCGKAAEYVTSTSHFKFVIQWVMWPATAMMIAAALTSVIIPVVKNLWNRKKVQDEEEIVSLADEEIPLWWTVTGITVSVTALVWLTNRWFGMPLPEILLAVALQPMLIVAGLRVLGITGSGPVSLMTNATQFLFGLLYPSQIRSNLVAAYISANPQASSENVVPAFWVAQRLGGRFKTLILAQLIVIPVGALLTPFMFNMLESTYGIGLNPGQLSAPTGLKIATLALVMEQGVSSLPHGALTASIIAMGVGVLFEVLLAFRKRTADGREVSRFRWVPIPSALGFSLILPASLNICMAIGSVTSAIWRRFSTKSDGSYEVFAAPLASGLIAGEAMVGSLLMPILAMLMGLFS